jgi:hypothetical protein
LAAVILKVAVAVVPKRVAVTEALPEAPELVPIEKFTVDAPAGTVTVGGTVTPEEAVRLTVVPPVSPRPNVLTVPLRELPALTLPTSVVNVFMAIWFWVQTPRP